MDGPLKWHGGKNYLAARIVAMMPPHIHYVEPYAGGLSVLLAKNPEGVSEVVNDLNGDLTNFWHVLQDDPSFGQFIRRISAVPFSEIEWRNANPRPPLSFEQVCGLVDYAADFFIRCRQSLAGRMDTFASLSRRRVRRGMNEQASAWLNCVEGLPQVHARLKRVVILNHDALKVIKQQDGPQTLFYLDPPYLHETRATTGEYAHEMSESDHRGLLNALGVLQGKFMLSGYQSDLYDERAKMHGWHRVEFDLPNNAAGGKTKHRKTECVWMNFEPVSAKVAS